MRQGSFVRKGAATAADPGTRPGLHSQTLVSSGHPDLDRLLGGGLPLGSLLLLMEDGWSAHHATLLRYFLAEGAACGQSLLLAAAPAPAGGLPQFIPAQAKSRTADKDEAQDKEQEEQTLRIAWQYRRYIKGGAGQPAAAQAAAPSSGLGGGSSSSRGGTAAAAGARPGSSGGAAGGSGAPRRPVGLRDWCHQFDLLKPAGEAGLQGCRAELADCSSGEEYDSGGCVPSTASVQRLVAAATEFAQSLAPAQPPGSTQPSAGAAAAAALPPRGPQHVGRIAVLSLGSLGWQLGGPDGGSSEHATQQQPSSGRAVLQALLQLKAAVRDRRCAAVVSVPAALFSASDVARMQHLADGVIALESMADGSDIVRLAPDAASVAGLLHLRKLPALGTLAPPAPEAPLHLIRHKRRRLAISPVEIDPEAELAEAEAASGAGRSVASVLCGGPARADKALDF